MSAQIVPVINKYADHSTPDLLASFTEHIALRVSSVISGEGKRMLVSGGGAYNDFLLSRMEIHSEVDIHIPDPTLLEYKEAMIFAFLGLLRLKGIDNVLSSVTGSGQDHCAGKIIRPATNA